LVSALVVNGDYLEVQVVPRDDFLTALQSGVMGDGTGGAAAGGAFGGGGGGTGVGGGGGGTGGFGGVGGALGAAAAIGFAAGASEGENQPTSSFAP
jgi:hypothetical protein